MNRRLKYLLTAGLILLIFVIDMVGLKPIAWARTVINPTLLVIIIAVNWSGLKIGWWCALVAGWIAWLHSSLASGAYLCAYLATAALVWLLVRRIFAVRANTSYLGLIIIGTLSFYIFLGLFAGIGHAISPTTSPFYWQYWWPLAASQCLSHPLVAAMVWRISGRGRQLATAAANQGKYI